MIELTPISSQDFPVILQRCIDGFAKECVEAGRWKPADAMSHANNMILKDLPEGINTPNHLFFHLVLIQSQKQVGYLWLELITKDDLPTVFIADIEINPEFRRQGIATATFEAVEKKAKKLGINRVCLHVFKNNVAAQALYQKLGFETTGLNMLKNL